MTKNVNPAVFLKQLSVSGQAFRLAIATLMFSSLIACAAAPTKPASSMPATQVKSGAGLVSAVDMYDSGNYPGALSGFDTVIADERSNANDRRLAQLGKAMVYLGSDENLHSMEYAKMSLIAAGQVTPKGNEAFSFETNLLMDAVSAVIGSESKYVALQAKSGNSGAEVVQLKRDRDQLTAERDELLAEQKRLNEALERLKQLTLGN